MCMLQIGVRRSKTTPLSLAVVGTVRLQDQTRWEAALGVYADNRIDS